MDVALIGGIVALIFGIVSEVEGRARNWAGWGVITLAIVLLYGALN